MSRFLESLLVKHFHFNWLIVILINTINRRRNLSASADFGKCCLDFNYIFLYEIINFMLILRIQFIENCKLITRISKYRNCIDWNKSIYYRILSAIKRSTIRLKIQFFLDYWPTFISFYRSRIRERKLTPIKWIFRVTTCFKTIWYLSKFTRLNLLYYTK